MRVNKVWLSRWNAQGHVVAQPLAGAELAVYKIDANGVLYYANQTATTDTLGNAVFAGLDGTKQYVVVEVKAPDGYSLPDNMSGLASANALDGSKYEEVNGKYNFTEPYNFNSDTTLNDKTIEKSLVNYDNWVQFKLTSSSAI